MSRKSVLRAVVCLSPVLPLASAACGQGFREQPSAQEEDRDSGSGNVLVGDASRSRDDAGHDGGDSIDAHRDAPGSDAMDEERADAPEASASEAGAEAGAAESGAACPTGSLTCEDGGCVPNDVHNCGACGVACSGGTPVCDGTQCVSGCPAAKPTLCDGTCVNTSDDPQNCGACSTACTGNPANSQATCSAGACGWQCDTGFSQCGSACDDLTNDPSNCGQCGAACTGNPADSQATCSGGVCGFACDTGYRQCGSSCLLAVPDTVHGVFVAPGGPTGGCGTPDIPCGTISAALAAIQQADAGTKNIVYVAESATPYADQIEMVAGVTIEGGWVNEGAGAWSHPCALDPSQVVVQALPGADRVVDARFTGSATIRTLTLVDKPSAPTAGQSIYGAFVSGTGTQLSLENVQILMGAAGRGVDGSPGVAGVGAVACTMDGDQLPGANGAVGSAGPAGGYSASGYASGVTGGTGVTGDQGNNGGTGLPGGSCTPTGCHFDPLTFECSNVTGTTVRGANGSPGCGGNGGQGGGGGSGGGSSIAVFAWGSGAQVSITSSSIYPGNGGGGGNGAVGGAGAPGVAGTRAPELICAQGRCPAPPGRVCIGEAPTQAFGGAGGSIGGTGGQGGTGGGGAGGDSYCTYAGGGATITGTPQCTPAAGGAGGAPNGPPGTGAAQD